MNPSTQHEVTQLLIRDYGFKQRGKWLQAGTCPSCSKKELFTNTENPWTIRCGRENNCAYEESIKTLYPEIFEGFNKRHKPTETNPNATADAYMQMQRGFDLTKIKGWYDQGSFFHADADKGTATVRFWLDDRRTIHMERFVEQVTITDPDTGERTKRKAHFKGSHEGMAWAPPGMKVEHNDEIMIVEGCLDAIACTLNGFKAVAALSCVNYPKHYIDQHKGKNITWVWALDNDMTGKQAGRRYTKKWVKRMRAEGHDCDAAMIPQGRKKVDWNDLHISGKLNNRLMEEYRYQGAKLIARSASEKAILIYQNTERREFPFDYNNRTYWFKMDLDKFAKAVEKEAGKDDGRTEEQIREDGLKEAGAIVEIANCKAQFLYFQSNLVTDESWYYCRISFPHRGTAIKNTFTGSQLSGASEFKKRLLGIAAGAVFTGTTGQLDSIVKYGLYNIKTVDTVDFIGYSKEHRAYIYNDLAVKDGQMVKLNEEDFFEFDSLSVKSLSGSVNLQVNPVREHYKNDWLLQLHTCFGAKGITALAFWFGSLFAEQIREYYKFYPFLEVIGEAGAGKSTLIEFMWKLYGRPDEEGFDPCKSTAAARARKMAQVSNLPVVLIESDREDSVHARGFDWDELKTAYNGRSVRSRGQKSSGNETYDPPFRGSIVIAQNNQVNASEAILQRICHLHFTKGEHNAKTKALAEALERTPMEQISGFLLMAISKERQILQIIKEKTAEYENTLMAFPDIKTVRIAKNHALLMALVDALATVIPLGEEITGETHDCIADMAIERQHAINSDHPIVVEFWEMFDFLDGDNGRLDHSRDASVIAVNINEFVQRAAERKQQLPCLIQDLKKHLKTSKARKFIDVKSVNSAIDLDSVNNKAKTKKCWVFQRER
ncbi:MAG: toprim domain-containing protein [Candidatus Sedimenticola sp. (ex Thyasira tokunagai)]